MSKLLNDQSEKGQKDVIDKLFESERGRLVDDELEKASRNGNPDLVDQLLKRGEDGHAASSKSRVASAVSSFLGLLKGERAPARPSPPDPPSEDSRTRPRL